DSMPKQVDHDARRRQITEAVWRIASVHGLEAASMRRIAAEAGLSTPLVQRYFPDKDTLLRHAFTELTADAQHRSEQRVAAAIDPAHPHDLARPLRALLEEFLPIDEQRRTMLLVHIAYFARALADDTLVTLFRNEAPSLVAYLAELLRAEQHAGRA